MTSVNLGPLSLLPSKSCFESGSHRVAVFRVEETVYAVADRCTHAEASLSEGEVFDGEVECPRHGATFDLTTGAVLALPATKPVKTYPIEIRDGDVLVELEA